MAVNKKTNSKTKPKVTSKSKKPASKQKQYIPSEKEIKIRNEIKLLCAFAITVLVELGCFGYLSPLGDYISYFIFGCFGIIGYVLPIILFLGIAFLLSNRNNRNAVIKFVTGTILLLLIISIIHLIFMEYDSENSPIYYYIKCGEEKIGGGLFGSFISNGLCNLVGIAGAYIILLILLIITLVILTEKSFIGGVKKGSKKIYSTAVNDVERIRESAGNYNREKTYQKNKRINKRIKGVKISKINDPYRQDEDMHEITDEIPKNASIYRGKVDLDKAEEIDNDEGKYAISNPNYGNDYSYEQYNNEQKNPDSEMVKEAKEYDNKKEHFDEDGMYKPTEKIEVSQKAKDVMARKAYTGQDTTNNKENPKKNVVAGPEKKRKKTYVLPKTNLLNKSEKASRINEFKLRQTADDLQNILKNFGVSVEVTEYHRGPSVTRYEVQPEIGTRLSKITALADDIKLNLAATDIRIEPIPGKSTIGIEVPNDKRDVVSIRELIESKELMNNKSKIAFAAGTDITGKAVIGDIAKMPHMLVAGTTGSGKSVFTNSIIMSILFRATPDEVRLIIVDPKVVEFGVYNGIPHLLQPVVTDARLASNTLKWAVNEMSQRYKRFADLNVRDLKGYNEKVVTMDFDSEEERLNKLPQIVIVIDELADLMMAAAKEVEESICRLAQLARAAGIHLIIATQRPSVDVVTGLIKANIPSRVALMVSSGVDSRTIIDSNGAEKLLGNGDMLFYPSGYVKPVRLQGAFVSDAEVQRVVEFWLSQAGDVTYDEEIAEYISSQPVKNAAGSNEEQDGGRDEYFLDAARFCIEKQKASTSMLQRMFKIGFNRASRIVDQLEDAGIIGSEEGTKPRKVLMTVEEFEEFCAN